MVALRIPIVSLKNPGVERRDRHMAASIQFHVGNKCYFSIDGKRMNGEIASLNVEPGVQSVSANDVN